MGIAARHPTQPVGRVGNVTAEPFVFPAYPANQGTLQVSEHWGQRRPVEPAVVVHPAAHRGIHQPSQVFQRLVVPRGGQPYAYPVATTTDPLGNTTTNSYSGANLVATPDAAGRTTKYTYDGRGNQASVTDPAGNVTRFEYDGAGNLVRQTDALGHAATFTYDASG